MVEETILQHWIFTKFALPFLLIFFIVFAILEKTNIFGEGKKQLNALVAFVVSLIFVGVSYPVDIVSNLILFLTVALIAMFVGLLLWGFVIGGEAKIDSGWVKILLGVVITLAVIGAVLWATGFYTPIWDWLFGQDWSNGFWTNILFVIVIAVALVLVLKSSASK